MTFGLSSIASTMRACYASSMQGSHPRWVSAGLSWSVEFVIALGAWCLLVAKLEMHELAVGAVAAAFAATASMMVREQGIIQLGGYARDFAQLWRIPKQVIEGTWGLACVLGRHLTGRGDAPSLLREVPFDDGPDEDRGAMRRALACAYTSMTPNFIVLGYDRERRRMIFHQVRRTPIPEMTKRLGAKP